MCFKRASKELAAYRKQGPNKSTRILLAALKSAGVEGRILLDIGGGVGVLQFELLAAGVSQVTSVEASTAYLQAAQEEAARRGYADRIRTYRGDFVDLASEIAPADIVTLDRVLCCYHDVIRLVERSAERADRLYGLVYPPDTWWMKLYTLIKNHRFGLRGHPFRLYVHPTRTVDTLVVQQGFERRFSRQAGTWQIVIYERRHQAERRTAAPSVAV